MNANRGKKEATIKKIVNCKLKVPHRGEDKKVNEGLKPLII